MATLVVAAVVLVLLGQFAAAALLPPIALLLREIERRDQRARVLAQSIAAGQLAEKIEVPRGEWGNLSRAVNNLLQEHRIQQRLRSALPEPLPEPAIQSLLMNGLPPSTRQRVVAIMLVSHTSRSPAREDHGRRASLAWQTLAQTVQTFAREHGALLQPCGDSIMLAFGAFEERSAGEALRSAVAVAEALRRSWRGGGQLVLSLASGSAMTLALPGLGYCVVGAPVEQAMQLQQQALQGHRYGLLCNEDTYYVLRHNDAAAWQPTDLRIPVPNRPPQVVYGWNDLGLGR